jgi:hypothetical protein
MMSIDLTESIPRTTAACRFDQVVPRLHSRIICRILRHALPTERQDYNKSGAVQLRTIALAVAIAVVTSADLRADDQDWLPVRSHDVELTVTDSTIKIRTTGGDPYMMWRLKRPLKTSDRVLEFQYFCTESIDSVTAFIGPPITEAGKFALPNLTIAEGWQTYAVDLVTAAGKPIAGNASLLRIDLGVKPDVRLLIRRVRLRSENEEDIRKKRAAAARRQEKIDQSRSIVQYLKESFPLRIDKVIVDDQFVTIRGPVPPSNGDRSAWQLIEFPPHVAVCDPGMRCNEAIEFSDDSFLIRVPRLAAGRDRLQSGWRIRSGRSNDGPFLSARHYATEIVPSSDKHAAERARPRTQKGLSGISPRGPLDELPQLGIGAVTINLVLNHFLSASGGKGKQRLDGPGPSLYFDSRRFAHYDALIDFARRHQMVVTAIVLIPQATRSRAQSLLVHPETDGGVYAMPDLSTARGAQVYASVLDRIAARYANSEQAPGGITNWIAHNEIDFHPVWTNMGRQPRSIVTETYYRSMRMIHNIARRYNPHARVFASLTHHWVVPDDGNWGQLAPREVLESLQHYSELEGDFAWGVAYHPYPQSLFAPVPWKDTDIRDDLKTPLITIQNLEVLGRFLDQAKMRDAAGNRRPVLLSEQGFHSESYGDQAQAFQAGSLWYAMQKVRSFDWIESFHYHRWIDHPDEGGLKLGLRTLPSTKHPFGERKRAWHVYQAIGTEKEAEAIRGLPAP